jgi:acyl-CoA thioester hydrolase
MNVVGHIQWIGILHKARIEALEHAGYPLQKLYDQGHSVVVSEFSIQYRKPARFGDLLEIDVDSKEPFKYGFVVGYEVRKASEPDRLITSQVKIMFVGPQGSACRMPDDFRKTMFNK